jgi:hypothetical protein
VSVGLCAEEAPQKRTANKATTGDFAEIMMQGSRPMLNFVA